MPELRLNVITNEWVIISKERSFRPSDFRWPVAPGPLPAWVETCPFCPGNEALSPQESLRRSGADGSWQTRVVANKFPALSAEVAHAQYRHDGLKIAVDGFGFHEVIIDSPRHDLSVGALSDAAMTEMLATYRARYQACAADARIQQVLIFKNQGERAGSSLVHPHSQLIATPVVSNQVRERVRIMEEYHAQHGVCLGCQMLAEELSDGVRVLLATEHFVAFIPYAALSTFHTWIFPRRHMARFGAIADAELQDLARVLGRVVGAMGQSLSYPDYNYVIRSAPRTCAEQHFHWYLTIVPRLSRAAGFELGSGMFINAAVPEESAAFLRHAIEALPEGSP